MTGWLWYALWLDLWSRILAPEPEPEPKHTADVIDLADWRREHLHDDGDNGHGGLVA